MSARLQANAGTGDVTIVAATTAPFPPISFGSVPAGWSGGSIGVVPEIDIDLLPSGSTGTLTDGKIYAGRLFALVNADDTFTATNATETFTAVAHGLFTGDGPFLVSSSTTLPAGLSATTNYWIIRVDADNFKLALSLAAAGAGTVVAITTDGTGTHTIADTADTMKVVWRRLGTPWPSISLASAREGESVRVQHNPRVVAYAVAWTGTSSNAVTATASVVERT